MATQWIAEDGFDRIKPRSRPIIARGRVQLAGALILSLALPLAFRLTMTPDLLSTPGVIPTILGSVAATIFGFLAWRRIDRHTNVVASGRILCCFYPIFLSVMAIFLLLRLDYNRYVFFFSMVLCPTWFIVIQLWISQNIRPRFAVIPGGGVGRLPSLPGADFFFLGETRLSDNKATGVVADLRHDHNPQWDSFIADLTLAGIPVYHYKQVEEVLAGRVSITHLSENTFGSVLPDLTYLKIKQILDFCLAVLLLPVLLPFMAITALVILITDGRPILYRQERMGYRGRPFTAYKFRTMINRGSAQARTVDDAITRENDPRVTPVGRFLRKYRFDELPQVLNILRGEMSWIGPRPEAIQSSSLYESRISFYRYRHAVRPGISGWAQVKQGHVTAVDAVVEKLQYDFYYIKNVSIWLDIVIVFETLRTILFGIGSK